VPRLGGKLLAASVGPAEGDSAWPGRRVLVDSQRAQVGTRRPASPAESLNATTPPMHDDGDSEGDDQDEQHSGDRVEAHRSRQTSLLVRRPGTPRVGQVRR